MLGIIVTLDVVYLHQAKQATLEVLVILVLGFAPLYLTESSHTWKLHVLYVCKGGHVFCPEVSLYTNDMLLLFGSER